MRGQTIHVSGADKFVSSLQHASKNLNGNSQTKKQQINLTN